MMVMMKVTLWMQTRSWSATAQCRQDARQLQKSHDDVIVMDNPVRIIERKITEYVDTLLVVRYDFKHRFYFI